MEFTKTENGFVKYDENGKVIAEITYSPTDNPDIMVADMKQQNKKIKASCSYVVKKFSEDSSYDFINTDK